MRVFDLLEGNELSPNWFGATEFVSDSGSDVTEASGCSGRGFCTWPMAARRRARRTASASFCGANSLCEADVHADDSQSLEDFETEVAGAAVDTVGAFWSCVEVACTSFNVFVVKFG